MLNISFVKEAMESFLKDMNVDKSRLYDNGAIYYMNGNDGTDFDFNCNDRACEFYMYWPSEDGALKLLLSKDKIIMYYYPEEDPYNHELLVKRDIPNNNDYDLYEVCTYLYGSYDRKNIYDEKVENWELETEECFNTQDDEDEYGYFVATCDCCGAEIYDTDDYYECDGNYFCSSYCKDEYYRNYGGFSDDE